MRVVLTLLAAHILGDFVLQPSAIFQWKQADTGILLLHAAIWAAAIGLGLVYVKRFTWSKFGISFLLHATIDYWKLHFNPYPSPLYIMIIDQMLHMLQLILVSYRGESNHK